MTTTPKREEMEGEGKDKPKVCVTGGTGFVASWLIKKLLEDGYSVTTTVRSDPEKKKDYSFLTNLPRASEKLQIYHADLDDPTSFNPAIEGCVGVFHVATPVDRKDKEVEEVIVRRSIDGALGILHACLKSKTVKRVVYTSSAATVQCIDSKEESLDESYWSDIDCIRNYSPFGLSYTISKTLTERAVLDFSEQYGLEVVSVIPTFVSGPFICPKFPGSVQTTLALILGDEATYGFLSKGNMVHVDDVARAHIFLFENPTAKGRYICSSYRTTLEEFAEFLSTKYPQFHIPSSESLKDVKGVTVPYVSSKKLLDSGFQYQYGIDEMLDGAIQSCKEKGYL